MKPLAHDNKRRRRADKAVQSLEQTQIRYRPCCPVGCPVDVRWSVRWMFCRHPTLIHRQLETDFQAKMRINQTGPNEEAVVHTPESKLVVMFVFDQKTANQQRGRTAEEVGSSSVS